MRIQTVNNNVSSKGLYFTRIPNVLFNRNQNINYARPADYLKVSEQGFKYIEDKAISNDIKEKFLSNPFIKELAEKFDTFVFFREVPKNHPTNSFANSHVSFARISWADSSKDYAEHRLVCGNSPISQEYATATMFRNLNEKKFSNV